MADKISKEEKEAFFKKLDDFIAAYSAHTIDDYEEDEEDVELGLDTSRSSRTSRASRRDDPKCDTSTDFTHFTRGTSERKTLEGRLSRSSTVPKRRSSSLCPKPVSDPRTGCTYMLVKGHMPSWKGMCKHCGEYINMDSHMFFMKCSTGNPEDEMFFTKVLGTDQFPAAGVRNPRDSTPVPWCKSDEDKKAADVKSPTPSVDVDVPQEEPSTPQADTSTSKDGGKEEAKAADENICEGAAPGLEEPRAEESDVVELLYDRVTGAITVRDGLREVNIRQPRRRNEGN